MTVTISDLFCGAGGSSIGAERAGGTLIMAANHWKRAIEVHQAHFPNARHDLADISQADPRRYPTSDILLASPECTNHSQSRGISRKKQDPSLWDAPDPDAERSRATMWDVVRFAEQINYAAIVVENVVEATKWVLWQSWWSAIEALGYKGTVLSINSMHHDVPQSRDRIYVVWARKGLKIDLEWTIPAHCNRCESVTMARKAFKQGRAVGRYKTQWVWSCTQCHYPVEPATLGAETIIDWSLTCPRIGDRKTPLADNTRSRILAGMQKYGWAPITTIGAGNGFERTPGNRARAADEPVTTQTTTAQTALATPPGFLLQTCHGGRVSDLDKPHPTVCATDDRQALVMAYDSTNIPRPVCHPTTTVTTHERHALVIPMRRNADALPIEQPAPTVTAGGNHHGLLMRNNTGGSEMVTPVSEPARTLTTAGHQSLLSTTRTLGALDVDDCGFRMLEPFEVAGAMAFPVGYIPRDLPKKEQVKLAGNAVTPPVMHTIVERIIMALEAA